MKPIAFLRHSRDLSQSTSLSGHPTLAVQGLTPRSLATIVICLSAAFTANQSKAADEYWKVDGTTGTWTSPNWSTTGGAPYATGWTANNNAIFNANSLITYVTATQVGNITVADGFNVTMTAAGTYSTGGVVRTLTVGTGSVLDFAAQSISTSAGMGFIKNGAGIFYSGNGNAYLGGFTLNAGTIVLGGVNGMGAGALTINGGTIAASNTRNITARYSSVTIGGDFTLGGVTTGVVSGNGSATANITFADNMALGAANRTITIGSNGTYTLGGVLSGATGTGLIVNAASGATGNLTLSNTNTFTGGLTINSGIVSVSSTLALGSGQANSSSVVLNGGTLRVTASVTGVANRGFRVGSSTGTIEVSATRTFGIDGTIQDIDSQNGRLAKIGAGTLQLNTSNSFTGGLSITGGAVSVEFANRLGSSTALNSSAVLINGGILRFSDTAATTSVENRGFQVGSSVGTIDVVDAAKVATIEGSIQDVPTQAGSLVKTGAGRLVLSAANSFTGGLTVSGGILSVGSTTYLGSSIANSSAVVINGGTLSFSGTGLITSASGRGYRVGSSGGTIEVVDTNRTIVFSGALQNVDSQAGNLVKTGAGALVLNAASSVSTASVSAGTLLVNNSFAVDTLGVSAAGTLGGTGSISGATTISGTHAAGYNAVGTQTFTSSLSYVADSIFSWDLNAGTATQPANTSNFGSYDKVIANGAVTGSSVFTVVLGVGTSFADAFWDTDKNWTNIFTTTGAGTFNLQSIFGTFGGAGVASDGSVASRGQFTYSGNTLGWSAVPEPTTALAGILLGAGLLRRRRSVQG